MATVHQSMPEAIVRINVDWQDLMQSSNTVVRWTKGEGVGASVTVVCLKLSYFAWHLYSMHG